MSRLNSVQRRRVRWIGLRVKEQNELGEQEMVGMDWIKEEKGRINRERGVGQDGLGLEQNPELERILAFYGN